MESHSTTGEASSEGEQRKDPEHESTSLDVGSPLTRRGNHLPKSIEEIDKCNDCAELTEMLEALKREIAKKEEQLRELKLVQHYRTENEPERFQELIDKWRKVAQQAILKLHSRAPEPKPSLTELINQMHIDHELVKYNADEEDFVE